MNRAILHRHAMPRKDYDDPREQTVSVESVREAMRVHDEERVKAGFPPDYRHSPEEPSVFERALTGRLPASDICSACGQTRQQHFDHSGCILLGCDYAKTQPSAWPMNPVVYADPYPAVTLAVRNALVISHPALAAFLSTFAYDDLLGIAYQLGHVAIEAYTQERAK